MKALDFDNPPDEYFDGDELLVLLDLLEDHKSIPAEVRRTIMITARCIAAEMIKSRGYPLRRARRLAIFGIVPYRVSVNAYGAMFGGWEHPDRPGMIRAYVKLVSSPSQRDHALILDRPSTQAFARCAFCGFFLRPWEGGAISPTGMSMLTRHTEECALRWRVRDLNP